MFNLLAPTDSPTLLLCLYDFCVIGDNCATNIDNEIINRDVKDIFTIIIVAFSIDT